MINYLGRQAARLAAVGLLAAGISLAGCSYTGPSQSASQSVQRQQIEADANATLSKLYANAPGARQLINNASGVLVFPSVVGGSFLVGGEYGRGVLREHGTTTGYYSIGGGSFGFQAGVQSRAVILVFTNGQALRDFKSSSGWSVGADAAVNLITVGASGYVDSSVANRPVVGFVLTNLGLSGGVSLHGSKVTPL